MPPGIKPCRTCKLARQAVFMQGVESNDPDAKTVLYLRIGVIVLLGAVGLYLLFI